MEAIGLFFSEKVELIEYYNDYYDDYPASPTIVFTKENVNMEISLYFGLMHSDHSPNLHLYYCKGKVLIKSLSYGFTLYESEPYKTDYETGNNNLTLICHVSDKNGYGCAFERTLVSGLINKKIIYKQ